ncbi:MAG: DUF502 domain-containing protein [Haloarculaceae archaeon]
MSQSTGTSGGVPGGAASADPARGTVEQLRQILVSGAAITIPAIVTIFVLWFAVNFVLGLVGPGVIFLTDLLNVGESVPPVVLELTAVLTLVAIVFVVGFVAEKRSGAGIEEAFDRGMARLPGIGSVYTSFNEMSELILSSDSRSFREVKLVEYPTEGSYALAFVTAEAPGEISAATGHDDLMTLFMPMAPNPVMGGFVIHVSADRVHDVDLTVEEGIQSILTSGVAVGDERAVDDRGTDALDGRSV